MLTKKEIELCEKAGQISFDFRDLPAQHTSDVIDINFHVHAIQNIIFQREGYRQYKETLS